MATKEEKFGKAKKPYQVRGRKITCWKAWKKEGKAFFTSFGKQVGENEISWASWAESPNKDTASKGIPEKKYSLATPMNKPENG